MLATEEEKQKLFQAIMDNGYAWNSETRTLDKLITTNNGNEHLVGTTNDCSRFYKNWEE